MKKILIFFMFTGACFARLDPKMFGEAFENYLTGDYGKALKVSEQLYKNNPGEPRAKDLYHKSLVKMSLESESKKDYHSALIYIKDAEKLNPTDETAQIKKRILSEINKPQASKAVKKVSPPVKKKVKKQKPAKRKKHSKTKKAVKPEKAEANIKIVKKPEARAKMKYPTSIFILMFFNLLGLVVLMYFVAIAFSRKKEEKLMEEERRISQIVQTLGNKSEYQALLQNQKEIMGELEKLPEETSMMKLQNAEVIRLIERLTKNRAGGNIELPAGSARAGISGVDDSARIRADTVELIAQMFAESPILEDLIEPYINDENNRVRGNACKALFPRNRKKSLDTAAEMATSDNMWMRMSAAWVCGELAVTECVKILAPLLNDSSVHVRKRALLSFEKIKEAGVSVPAELEEKIYELKEKDSG